MPWWQYRLYLDGLVEEFSDDGEAEGEREVPAEDFGFTVREH